LCCFMTVSFFCEIMAGSAKRRIIDFDKNGIGESQR